MARQECEDYTSRSMVLNKSQSVSQGTNSDVTLTNSFNKKTRFVIFELSESGTVVASIMLPIERFKQINTAADTRVSYWDGQAAYNVGVYYVNDSKVHIQAYIMPITLTFNIRSLEES